MYLDIPTKDLPLWLCFMEEICQRSEPPLLRLKRESQMANMKNDISELLAELARSTFLRRCRAEI